MQTNGFLADESKIRDIVKAGLKNVSISLDTLDPQKFDSICKSKNAWGKVVENMYYFSKYLPGRGNLLIMNSVVTNKNISELPKLVRFANSLGFYSAFIPLHVSKAPENKDIFKDYAPELVLGDKYKKPIEEAYNKIISMKKRGFKIANSFSFLKKSSEFLRGKNVSWKCDAGSLYFEIGPNGDFFPCSELKAVGNIFTDDAFKKIRSADWKNKIKKSVRACDGCMLPCWTELSQLVHDPLFFTEKLFEILRITLFKRKVIALDEAKKFGNA